MLSGVYGGLITSRVTNTWHGDMRANTFFSAVSIILGREPTSSSIFSPRKVWAQHFRIQLLPTSLGLIFTLNLTGVMRPRFGQMFMLKLGLHELSLQCQLWKMRYKACRVQNVCRRAIDSVSPLFNFCPAILLRRTKSKPNPLIVSVRRVGRLYGHWLCHHFTSRGFARANGDTRVPLERSFKAIVKLPVLHSDSLLCNLFHLLKAPASGSDPTE